MNFTNGWGRCFGIDGHPSTTTRKPVWMVITRVGRCTGRAILCFVALAGAAAVSISIVIWSLPDPFQTNEVLRSAWKGDIARLKFALDHGGDPNARSAWDNPESDKAEALRVLHVLKSGKIVEGYHPTALIGASSEGHIGCAMMLVDRGANVNASSLRSGDTALHAAVEAGSINLVRFLLKHGANPSIKNFQGVSPLDLAARQNRTAISKLLRSYGATQ